MRRQQATLGLSEGPFPGLTGMTGRSSADRAAPPAISRCSGPAIVVPRALRGSSERSPAG
jgi:hypothetical protein